MAWPEHSNRDISKLSVAETIVEQVQLSLVRPYRFVVAHTMHEDIDLIPVAPHIAATVLIPSIPTHAIGSEGWLWLAVRYIDLKGEVKE